MTAEKRTFIVSDKRSLTDGVMRMNAAQLAALLSGMDWTRMHAPRTPRPKALV